MSVLCKKIQFALDSSFADGNSVKEIQNGWSEAKEVYLMNNKLSEVIKNKIILNEPSLKYWEWKGSTMDEPSKGFKCEDCKIVISFPVSS